MSPARPARWDRFECVLKGAAAAAGGRFQVAALGLVGWRQLKTAGVVPPGGMPAFVVRTLPSLVDRRGVVAVPHLGFRRADAVGLEFSAFFGPIHPLAVVPFTVASPPDGII
jgi:tRNA(Ile)-lysidine synthase